MSSLHVPLQTSFVFFHLKFSFNSKQVAYTRQIFWIQLTLEQQIKRCTYFVLALSFADNDSAFVFF